VRVLVFHGYLLRGTGSNVYNASLAEALVRLGHEVHLVCQDRHADELEFVAAVGDWDSGELVVNRVREGRCTVYRPDIGGLLPVYVADRYEGVVARPFPELSDAELDGYLHANVDAVSEVVSRHAFDVALANHLVMGPAILARALSGAGVPYAVKIHGSALEYTVKPHPRFMPYAREGLAAAGGVLVGSRHTAESLWMALADPSLPDRTRLGPPGVEVRRFRRRGRAEAVSRVRALADRIAAAEPEAGNAHAGPQTASSFSRDDLATAAALRQVAGAADMGPVVAFVGKLILAKGIDLLLASWPLVLAAVPDARLAVIGFGAYRDGAARLLDALARGDLEAVRGLARTGRAEEGGPATQLDYLNAFLEWLERSDERAAYLVAARALRERVIFTGRLEQPELAEVLPLCESIVVPSTFPESFGMVAVEAAACGALPISAAHSGLAEVSRALARTVPESVGRLMSFALGPETVQSIARSVLGWLGLEPEVQDEGRGALVQTAVERYSWEGVARGVIAAARGELAGLDRPGAV
jgi:glycosyltransferase involved in cell wall biosynthesis